MGRIPEAALFNAQVFVVATESAAQLDNKARGRGVLWGKRGGDVLIWMCACNNLLLFYCYLGINTWTGRFKHMPEKSQQQEGACGKTGTASRTRAPGESRRYRLAFCPHTEHSLSVVVGDICKLLPPGPVHRIFEPLKRNSDIQSLCKCRW